ncbi:invertase/pectin methylesterase inhibitor family protein [Tripterygium wilfordii]|uniref:Invertase/pectin methylesterase inhibitor family protein n=1 Tax=Tripterygium wilfordii TaxID=458696 RepID=A0A7J7CES1_TRIWF|nr:pectinesterase inhibitor-like [Tripterygium wilfordii]KAF5732638.1 invertase/pectin methylesterase inhibitor family protein [Tripterygium wilfordii]
MKMKAIFFLLSLALCLTLLPQPTIAKNHINHLIAKICRQSGNCTFSLKSNPVEGQRADLVSVTLIAIRLASDNAVETSSHIKSLLNNTADMDPSIEQGLFDCSDQYLDAIEQLNNSMAALVENDYKDLYVWISTAMSDAESCEDGFKDVKDHPSVLTDRNNQFSQLCKDALTVSKHLLTN